MFDCSADSFGTVVVVVDNYLDCSLSDSAANNSENFVLTDGLFGLNG